MLEAPVVICPAAAGVPGVPMDLPKILQDPPKLILEGGSAPALGGKRGSRASIFGVLSRQATPAADDQLRPSHVQNTPNVSLHSMPA